MSHWQIQTQVITNSIFRVHFSQILSFTNFLGRRNGSEFHLQPDLVAFDSSIDWSNYWNPSFLTLNRLSPKKRLLWRVSYPFYIIFHAICVVCIYTKKLFFFMSEPPLKRWVAKPLKKWKKLSCSFKRRHRCISFENSMLRFVSNILECSKYSTWISIQYDSYTPVFPIIHTYTCDLCWFLLVPSDSHKWRTQVNS